MKLKTEKAAREMAKAYVKKPEFISVTGSKEWPGVTQVRFDDLLADADLAAKLIPEVTDLKTLLIRVLPIVSRAKDMDPAAEAWLDEFDKKYGIGKIATED